MNMLKPPPQMAPQSFQLGGGPAPQTDPNLFATPGMPTVQPGMPGPQPGQQQSMYGALAPGRPNMMDPRMRQQMMMRQLYGY